MGNCVMKCFEITRVRSSGRKSAAERNIKKMENLNNNVTWDLYKNTKNNILIQGEFEISNYRNTEKSFKNEQIIRRTLSIKTSIKWDLNDVRFISLCRWFYRKLSVHCRNSSEIAFFRLLDVSREFLYGNQTIQWLCLK